MTIIVAASQGGNVQAQEQGNNTSKVYTGEPVLTTSNCVLDAGGRMVLVSGLSAAQRVTVLQSTGPPVVTLSDDVTSDHREHCVIDADAWQRGDPAALPLVTQAPTWAQNTNRLNAAVRARAPAISLQCVLFQLPNLSTPWIVLGPEARQLHAVLRAHNMDVRVTIGAYTAPDSTDVQSDLGALGVGPPQGTFSFTESELETHELPIPAVSNAAVLSVAAVHASIANTSTVIRRRIPNQTPVQEGPAYQVQWHNLGMGTRSFVTGMVIGERTPQFNSNLLEAGFRNLTVTVILFSPAPPAFALIGEGATVVLGALGTDTNSANTTLQNGTLFRRGQDVTTAATTGTDARGQVFNRTLLAWNTAGAAQYWNNGLTTSGTVLLDQVPKGTGLNTWLVNRWVPADAHIVLVLVVDGRIYGDLPEMNNDVRVAVNPRVLAPITGVQLSDGLIPLRLSTSTPARVDQLTMQLDDAATRVAIDPQTLTPTGSWLEGVIPERVTIPWDDSQQVLAISDNYYQSAGGPWDDHAADTLVFEWIILERHTPLIGRGISIQSLPYVLLCLRQATLFQFHPIPLTVARPFDTDLPAWVWYTHTLCFVLPIPDAMAAIPEVPTMYLTAIPGERFHRILPGMADAEPPEMVLATPDGYLARFEGGPGAVALTRPERW